MDRLHAAKQWSPIGPPADSAATEMVLVQQTSDRVARSASEIRQTLTASADTLERPLDRLAPVQGVIHFPGGVNVFKDNFRIRRNEVTVEVKQRASLNATLNKVKRPELQMYCLFYKLDSSGVKINLINRIMDHASSIEGDLETVARSLLDNPAQFALLQEPQTPSAAVAAEEV